MKPIYSTNGSQSQPIDRHYWDEQDGQEMAEYRKDLSTQEKKDISQEQGELFGHLYATEKLGYQSEFEGDE
jgi:hypothetical protein